MGGVTGSRLDRLLDGDVELAGPLPLSCQHRAVPDPQLCAVGQCLAGFSRLHIQQLPQPFRSGCE
jgi:hypothetical protein